jgi:hypothetical protein
MFEKGALFDLARPLAATKVERQVLPPAMGGDP